MRWPPTRALNHSPGGGGPGSRTPQHTSTFSCAFAVGAKDGSKKYRAARFTSTRRPRPHRLVSDRGRLGHRVRVGQVDVERS